MSRVPIDAKSMKKAIPSKFQHFQPLMEVSELGTSIRALLRNAWECRVIGHSYDRQPPSPPSAELPPLGDANRVWLVEIWMEMDSISSISHPIRPCGAVLSREG